MPTAGVLAAAAVAAILIVGATKTVHVPVRIVDIAAGHGRYVLDSVSQSQEPARLRDTAGSLDLGKPLQRLLVGGQSHRYGLPRLIKRQTKAGRSTVLPSAKRQPTCCGPVMRSITVLGTLRAFTAPKYGQKRKRQSQFCKSFQLIVKSRVAYFDFCGLSRGEPAITRHRGRALLRQLWPVVALGYTGCRSAALRSCIRVGFESLIRSTVETG